MVNLVEAQSPIQRSVVKMAGLRQLPVEIEPGTVMSFWVPKHHMRKEDTTSNPTKEVDGNHGTNKIKKKTPKKPKPAIVLVHGFAAKGLDTWQFQIPALTRDYSVYVPDLLFFGGSITDRQDRAPEFQLECLAAALGKLGVERCSVVGFSYGGMIAFKMAEARPDLVRSLVVSGSVLAMTESINEASLKALGVSSSSELLLPETAEGLKALLSIATYRKLWFPNRLHKDYLKVMFNNRKEREELLEGMVNISSKDTNFPIFSQRILLLWGQHDNMFHIEHAKKMKQQLGEKATLEAIEKAGHLVHIERPCVYNRHLKKFFSSVHADDTQ